MNTCGEWAHSIAGLRPMLLPQLAVCLHSCCCCRCSTLMTFSKRLMAVHPCSGMPWAEVQQRQAALDRERRKLSYAPGPGGYSELADAALANMLRYGASLATNEFERSTGGMPHASPPTTE